MKIAFIGTHGTRKTTLCYELTAYLKNKNINVDMVKEVAGRCPLSINENAAIESELWIFHTMVAEEAYASFKYKNIVCDRSLLDSFVYTMNRRDRSSELIQHMENYCDFWIKTYDYLFKTKVEDNLLVEDGIRSVNREFQKRIDELLEETLKTKQIKFYQLEKNSLEEVLLVLDPIIDKLKK